MIWTLTVMLIYADVDKPIFSEYLLNTFNSKYECWDFLAENKIILIDGIYKEFRFGSKDKLKNFEFFCEGKVLKEV